MNKRIIALSIGFLIVILAIFGIREITSYKEVSFEIRDGVDTVRIYNEEAEVVSELTESQAVSLKTGAYSYAADDEQYSNEAVQFTVEEPMTIEVSPDYSADYLDELLQSEQVDIQTLISSTYTSEIGDYVIGDATLQEYGEWYSAKLIQKVSGGNQPDVYRIILQKQDDVWRIIVSPRLAVYKGDFSDIPEEVITQVDEPLSNAAYGLIYP